MQYDASEKKLAKQDKDNTLIFSVSKVHHLTLSLKLTSFLPHFHLENH